MTARIWIIDDDSAIRWVLEKTLAPEGYRVTAYAHADEALNQLEDNEPAPDVLITDIRMPGTDGLRALKWLQRRYPDLPVIVMTAHSDLDAAVASYREGAFEYLPKPFDLDEVKSMVRSALASVTTDVETADTQALKMADIIGEAPAMQEVFRAIGRLSHSSVTVLINGASGTGKERVALALHRNSVRADKPFVALNMAAIPRELIESELFGHERGAFTGANAQRTGRFEQANGGTLFLDEIGDMPLEVQTRLLRVLQEGEFHRVGGTTAIKVDVRIVAATHQDMEQLVADKQFRQDLFYRLNVIRVHMPDLAARKEDISLLAQHFLASAAEDMEVEQKNLSDQVLARFKALPWPGNVRQLENVCRWLTVMVSGPDVQLEDLPEELSASEVEREATLADEAAWTKQLSRWAESELAAGHADLLGQALPAFERALLQVALEYTNGRREQAAKLLGWGRNTLTRKIKELGLNTTEDATDE